MIYNLNHINKEDIAKVVLKCKITILNIYHQDLSPQEIQVTRQLRQILNLIDNKIVYHPLKDYNYKMEIISLLKRRIPLRV